MVRADRHRYILAIDFGTTFTGISHVNGTKKTVDDIQVIKNWPGPSKEFSEVWKTPSKIAYRSENLTNKNVNPNGNEVIWGYDVEPGMISYSWMKLRLDEHTTITEFDDENLAGLADSQGTGLMMLPPGKTALDVCTDYLSGVYKYTMSELDRTWGQAIVNVTPIDYWVTVPATWSDRAKALTKMATSTAGFGSRPHDRMFMITEPEAAAVAALTGLIGEGVEDQLKPGDGILVCDCGGGTVDINTYRIQATSPNLDFEELAVGQGGKVGSTFIDRQFHDWMGSHFGFDFYNLDFKKKGPGSRFMKEFEAIKRDFGAARNSQLEFRLPLVLKNAGDSKYYDEEEHMVVITKDDLKSFFDPSVDKIKELLDEQITKANAAMPYGKTVRTIILVGGFGDSQYLYDSLNAWCTENGHPRLLCPPNPQAAIVKGAALRGLGDIKPSRRLSRRHYGFRWGLPFIEGVHPEHLAYYHAYSGVKYCSGLMTWDIKKGQYLTEETKVVQGFADPWFVGDSKSDTLKLYASSQDHAAAYHFEGGCDVVGTIKYDFAGLDVEAFSSKFIRGRKAYLIDYTIEMHMANKQGTLAFKVVSNGLEVGKAMLDFNGLESMPST